MKFQIKKASTSVILTVFIQDSTVSTGAGLGSLDQTSSITGGYLKKDSTGVALAVDENVTTEGTYEAPSAAGKVRIGTPANMTTGVYELHFPNDLSTTKASVPSSLGGPTDMAPLLLEIQLVGVDLNDADGTSLTEAGGDGDHLAEAGGDGDHLTAIDLPNQTMDITGDITGNLSGSVGSLTGHTVQTGNTFAKFAGITLLAEWLGALAGKQAANSTALTEIKASGAGSGTYDEGTDSLEAVSELVVVADAAVDAIPTTAMRGTDSAATTADLLDKLGAVNESAAAGDPSSTESVMQYVKQIVNILAGSAGVVTFPAAAAPGNGVSLAEVLRRLDLGIVTSTTKAGTLSTTQSSTNLSEATNDHYNGRIITFTSGVLLGQSSAITDYVGTNGVLTYDAMTEAAGSSDSFKIT